MTMTGSGDQSVDRVDQARYDDDDEVILQLMMIASDDDDDDDFSAGGNASRPARTGRARVRSVVVFRS